MKFAPYSFSRISTYNTCPKKFDYQYNQKIKVPFVYSEALIKGGCVHHILENHPNVSTHKHQAKYQHIADKFLETDLGQHIFSYEHKREIDIGLTKDLELCDYKDKTAMFRGSVDCMAFDGTTMMLIDYKTGKLRDEKYTNYDQLSWYAIYFFIRYPKLENINISYVYVEHENQFKHKDYTRDDLETLTKTLTDNINKIEQDENFEHNIGPLCNYCDFQDHCDNERIQNIPNSFLDQL